MNVEIVNNINQDRFRLFLQDELVRRCRENPIYSLRAFARDLEIDNSVLSKILAGKRVLGKRLIKRLISKIEINYSDLNKLTENDQDKVQFEQLAIDSFAIISDWHHYAILELLSIDNHKSDVEWIASSLGLNINECKSALDRLIRVELVERLEDGTLIDVSGGRTTNISNDMKHGALRKMQKQLLRKSIECLDTVPYDKRSNTSMTMGIDTDKLPEAMNAITKFRRSMGKLLARGKKRDQVYNLSIALCPLSNLKKGE